MTVVAAAPFLGTILASTWVTDAEQSMEAGQVGGLKAIRKRSAVSLQPSANAKESNTYPEMQTL